MKQWTQWLLAASLAVTSSLAVAQSTMDAVEINATEVGERVYMLTGQGGNIGVFVGADQVVMVDAQYAPLADKIAAAIAELAEQPLKTLINTHFHGDHVNGNAAFAAKGVDNRIAHANVLARLDADTKFDKSGLPTITFEGKLGYQVGDETIQLTHYPAAHTDGDVVVWFPSANVIHAGDLFFVDRFPFIDLNAGGRVQGYIDAIEAVMADIDDDTLIIPGHGGLSKKADWQRLVSMIKVTREEVRSMQSAGLSEDQAVAQGLDAKWADWSWGFINEERWIRTLYKDMN